MCLFGLGVEAQGGIKGGIDAQRARVCPLQAASDFASYFIHAGLLTFIATHRGDALS